MTTPDTPDTAAALTAPIKTVTTAATDFSTDIVSWVQHSTLHAAIVFAIALGSVALLNILRRLLLLLLGGKQGKPHNLVRLLAFRLIGHTSTIYVTVLGCWLVARFIAMPPGVQSGLGLAFTVTSVIQIGLWVREVILVLVERRLIRQGSAGEDAPVASALGVIGWLVNTGVWSITLLLLLDNLGVNITALIAGLGIGGLAIGLAAQGIMADLFSALSIVFDKPFVRGDFIIFNDKLGTVEKIGLKTSRLRALSGEMIVVSNNQLLTSVIHNYQQMLQRRVLFSVGVVYGLAPEKVEKIPGLLKQAVSAEGNCRFDRAHFKGFGSSSLDFEVVYYYIGRDYNPYMDAHQAILLRIMRSFAAEGIDFAYPTQTIHLVKNEVA